MVKTRTALALLLLTALSLAPAAQAAQRPQGAYFDTLPIFWSQLYGAGGETLYCGKRFGPSKSSAINVEHVLPMSWVVKELGCKTREFCRKGSELFNRIESDMHNLYPALATINEARGAMAYGTVLGERRRFGSCDFEVDEKRRRAEPRRQVRGNIARAMFYMHKSYGIRIYRPQGQMLQQWNRQDPPDDAERRRNDRIQSLQGTRNPFIDRPDLADQLRF